MSKETYYQELQRSHEELKHLKVRIRTTKKKLIDLKDEQKYLINRIEILDRNLGPF